MPLHPENPYATANPYAAPNSYAAHPWQGSRSRPRTRISACKHLLLPLLIAFPLSILVFALEQVSNYILRANAPLGIVGIPESAFPPQSSSSNDTYLGLVIDSPIDGMPSNFIVATAVMASLFAAVSALAFWELRDGGAGSAARVTAWRWANVGVTVLNLALVVVCIVVVFLAESRNRREGLIPLMLAGKPVTRETLMCGAKDLKDWEGEDWVVVGCGSAVAGRWCLVPLLVASVALAGVCLGMGVRGKGKDGQKEGKGEEGVELGSV
ncbi:hypothetical protein BDV95DRAFT_607081 [Massariosphaeria phaeospora]|uniref:Uncharacterized protein n=1 Tax=Massariosphaeria phaeospora TaxID=100035 RepID=A0A7C8MC00_9PLEO|nr:hypothetical protein BDV95DRAFT_607081 [Massariosphaeria phaeospora]